MISWKTTELVNCCSAGLLSVLIDLMKMYVYEIKTLMKDSKKYILMKVEIMTY
jgi:hypothetical protein